MIHLVTRSLIASSVFSSVTLPLFIFRLWIRIRIRRVGWEDILAIIAFVCGTMNVVSDWVYVVQLGKSESSVIAMWIYMFTFTIILWSVRTSIILSIIRIIPARERLHKCGLAIIALFFIIFIAFITHEAVHCTSAYDAFQPTSTSPYFFCSLPRLSKICELSVGFTADTAAVVFPLCVLRRVTLPPREHRFLRLLFSSILMVSMACFLRALCELVPDLASWFVVVSNLQVTACLIVCNILVIATYLYRVLGYCRGHGSTGDTTEQGSAVEKDDLATLESTSRQMSLTTIEHLFSIPSGDDMSATSGETVPKATSATDSAC